MTLTRANYFTLSVLATVLMVSGTACSQRPDQESSAPNTSKAETNVSDQKEISDGEQPPRLRIAAIVTTFFPNSHAGVIVDKFLRGFPTDEGVIPPRTEIASLFIDQIHDRDVGRQLAHEFDIPLYESIRDALTLGGDELAVDAVLLIGEHGDYPRTILGQEMVPRRYFFEQIIGVIGESNRPIPIYNDKFFAYRWSDAKWMYDTAQEMKIPFWAASAMPVVWRKPNWEHADDQPVDRALVIGYHMVERYGYHALEILQCHVERRRGGETGVRSVQCLSGDDVWRAGDEGKWSLELANAALGQIEDGPGQLDRSKVEEPHVFLIEYNDGLQAAVLMLGDNGYVKKFAYAEQAGEVIDSLEYHVESGPTHAAFGYLGLNIEEFFITGVPPNPVERTYLATGILEAALISLSRGGERIETAHLSTIHYKQNKHVRRPTNSRPTGASIGEWKVLEPGATPAAKSIPIGRDGTTHGKGHTKE